MDLNQAIFTRRSVRKYNETPVEKETIKKIIEAGCHAPSACNVQGWHFIVIDDRAIINEILSNGAAAFLKNTRQAIFVVYDNRTDNDEYNDYIQSASACIENMLLMAHSLSVGACWINFLPPKKTVRRILNIPNQYEPIAMISIGYYDQKLNERPRKYTLDQVISWNRFSGTVTENQEKKNIRLRKIARKIYLHLPVSMKKRLGNLLDKKEKKFDN